MNSKYIALSLLAALAFPLCAADTPPTPISNIVNSAQVAGPLEVQLAGLVELAKQSSINAADFIQQQFPEFSRQLLTYHYFHSLFLFVVGLVFLSASAFLLKRTRNVYTENNEKTKASDHYSWGDSMIARFWINLLLCAVCFCFGKTYINYEWVQIQVAPNVYLAEYIKENLIK